MIRCSIQAWTSSWRGPWPETLRARRALLLWGILCSGLGFGGCAKQAPWLAYGPPQAQATLQAMAVDLVLGMKEDWASPRETAALCVGTGRRVTVGLRSASRDEIWDPEPAFLRALSAPGWEVYALSACDWDEEVREKIRETGAPAGAMAVSQVDWVTDRAATITIWIRENAQRNHRYTCDFQRPERDWVSVGCVYRLLSERP